MVFTLSPLSLHLAPDWEGGKKRFESLAFLFGRDGEQFLSLISLDTIPLSTVCGHSLDTLVTVVDLLNFDEYFASEEDLPDRFQNVPEEDDRTVVHLLMDQVSSCLSCGCATLSASTHHSGPADRVRQCDPPQQDG